MTDIKTLQILPPNQDRASIYGSRNLTEVKFLLPNGSVVAGLPIVEYNYITKVYFDGDDIYECSASPGSLLSDPVWKIEKATVAQDEFLILFANGDPSFVNRATDLNTVKELSYS